MVSPYFAAETTRRTIRRRFGPAERRPLARIPLALVYGCGPFRLIHGDWKPDPAPGFHPTFRHHLGHHGITLRLPDNTEWHCPDRLLFDHFLALREWVGLALHHPFQMVERARSRGEKIVFTNGCFDILHPGHIECLSAASSLGDLLVVGLNTDQSVRDLKGTTRPVNPFAVRREMLGAIDAVDLVLGFAESTPLRLIERIRPDILVKGGDYPLEAIVGAREVLAWGGRVETIPLVPDFSTTGFLARVAREG